MRIKVTRDFYIPRGGEKLEDGAANAVAYLDTMQGERWCAMGFGGKRQRPDFNYWFPTEETARAYVAKYFEGQREKVEAKAARRKGQRKFRTSLVVGDILYTSWGYEQTNVDFYQVIEVKPSGKSVVIQEVTCKVEATGFMCGSATPVKDEFTGGPMLKRVRQGESVKIGNHADAYKWDGKPKYNSWYH